MANILLREKARAIRKSQGASIKQIADKLKISKSTVSYWCRNIILSKDQIAKLTQIQRRAGHKGSIEYAEKIRGIRIQKEKSYKKLGQNDIGVISHRDLFILGIGLYWAEGYKRGNTEVGFTNSDPAMITIMMKWFKQVYGIKEEDFIFRVSINQVHKNRVEDVLKFWIKHTGATPSQFTKTSFIKSSSKKIYTNSENYFGVLRVKVRRGVNLLNRILASIEFLAEK